MGINTQVLSHPNDLVGYFDFNDITTRNAGLEYVMGYDNSEEFSKVFFNEFKLPSALSHEEKKEIIPVNLTAHMDALVRSNNRLRKNCEKILEYNKETEENQTTSLHEGYVVVA